MISEKIKLIFFNRTSLKVLKCMHFISKLILEVKLIAVSSHFEVNMNILFSSNPHSVLCLILGPRMFRKLSKNKG